ncbi:hypothetical protein ACJX0J_019092 [Zea mays]
MIHTKVYSQYDLPLLFEIFLNYKFFRVFFFENFKQSLMEIQLIIKNDVVVAKVVFLGFLSFLKNIMKMGIITHVNMAKGGKRPHKNHININILVDVDALPNSTFFVEQHNCLPKIHSIIT